ncbi:CGNR zinc finger domain-containing protein [Streptacidiphilus sp. PAMC 29251]
MEESDLDLAVELVNTFYALADPPDRLTDTATYQRILCQAQEPALAQELNEDDFPALVQLRAAIAPLFSASDLDQAAGVLNGLLQHDRAPVRLTVDQGTARWTVSAATAGLSVLRARLLGALAAHLVRHGTSRLGVCQAPPCTCVFVDRSRARTRRYCCDQCNDRAAAGAYRRRRAVTS